MGRNTYFLRTLLPSLLIFDNINEKVGVLGAVWPILWVISVLKSTYFSPENLGIFYASPNCFHSFFYSRKKIDVIMKFNPEVKVIIILKKL